MPRRPAHLPPQSPPLDIAAHLSLALDELHNAMAKHRAAWTHANQVQQHYKAAGRDPEFEPLYKRAMSDVSFWRQERAAVSASVSALAAALALGDRVSVPVTMRHTA